MNKDKQNINISLILEILLLFHFDMPDNDDNEGQ